MSTPFGCFVSFAVADAGLPSGGQILQSLIVAVFSGVVATLLFFEATNLVKHNHKQLAVVEATQAGEVLFTLLGVASSSEIVYPAFGILWDCYCNHWYYWK